MCSVRIKYRQWKMFGHTIELYRHTLGETDFGGHGDRLRIFRPSTSIFFSQIFDISPGSCRECFSRCLVNR